MSISAKYKFNRVKITPQSNRHPSADDSPALLKFSELDQIEKYWQDRYGDDRLVLLARDPQCGWAYWDLAPSRQKNLVGEVVLRLYDITGTNFQGENIHPSQDCIVKLAAGQGYLSELKPRHTYCVALGVRRRGKFSPLLHSHEVTMPPDGPSDKIAVQRKMSAELFEYLYSADKNKWSSHSLVANNLAQPDSAP